MLCSGGLQLGGSHRLRLDIGGELKLARRNRLSIVWEHGLRLGLGGCELGAEHILSGRAGFWLSCGLVLGLSGEDSGLGVDVGGRIGL